jgi:hypothetical protein
MTVVLVDVFGSMFDGFFVVMTAFVVFDYLAPGRLRRALHAETRSFITRDSKNSLPSNLEHSGSRYNVQNFREPRRFTLQ